MFAGRIRHRIGLVTYGARDELADGLQADKACEAISRAYRACAP
jgi:hypothetical protein